MTGSRFPMETELVYSSDSEDGDFVNEIAIDTKAQATIKSADAIETKVLTGQKSPDKTDL